MSPRIKWRLRYDEVFADDQRFLVDLAFYELLNITDDLLRFALNSERSAGTKLARVRNSSEHLRTQARKFRARRAELLAVFNEEQRRLAQHYDGVIALQLEETAAKS
jgi:hypothetical protein